MIVLPALLAAHQLMFQKVLSHSNDNEASFIRHRITLHTHAHTREQTYENTTVDLLFVGKAT